MQTIALVAHDGRKQDMLEWAAYNANFLARQNLVATATTGRLLRDELGLDIDCKCSGPVGGDMQIGAMIAEGKIDLLVFFIDPLCAHPHAHAISALLQVSACHDIPVACSRRAADMLISSPLLHEPSRSIA